MPPEQVLSFSLNTRLTLTSRYSAGFAAYLAALADPSVSYITLLLRRDIPSWADLPSNAGEKSKTIIVKDFTQYPEDVISQIADHDGCVWALGKSVRGLSEEEYMKIHVDFPVTAVEALKKAGVGSTGKPFSFVYVSGEGADPSQKSMFMWGRGKVRAPELSTVRGLTTDTVRRAAPRRNWRKLWTPLRPNYWSPGQVTSSLPTPVSDRTNILVLADAWILPSVLCSPTLAWEYRLGH